METIASVIIKLDIYGCKVTFKAEYRTFTELFIFPIIPTPP
jgi:hypothetical protein